MTELSRLVIRSLITASLLFIAGVSLKLTVLRNREFYFLPLICPFAMIFRIFHVLSKTVNFCVKYYSFLVEEAEALSAIQQCQSTEPIDVV